MAEFEIIDEYSYEVCLLPREKAFGFADYLNSIGIKAKAKLSYADRYTVFVTDSIYVSRAKQELLRFANSPYDKAFTKASWEQGKTVKREKTISSSLLFPMTFDIKSLTTIVEIICIALYLLSLVNDDFVVNTFALSRQEHFSDIFSFYKLLTPTFVHFSFMHIAFNLVMFEAMARPIEKTFGIPKLFTLFISIALLSNVLQYSFLADEFTVFGGLSGVVYGVIGYSGVLSRRKDLPRSFNVPNGLLAVSVIFVLFGFMISGIANLCHLGGLIVGVLWGLYDLKNRKLFSK